ncbi:very short patch repair endonuclease [Pseudovibrio denitrificans]|uniref:very short patch repair endonuclease n=1 Tax=Pseudovibrio denitrificans TaxID=258256 RepID=UPI0039BF63F2
MSAIRAKNTRPELLVRSQLHSDGFRFRLHNKELPGKPDLTLKKYRAVIFINGCFWHKHECDLFKWPKSRRDFWQKKLSGNHTRDKSNYGELSRLNWRVCLVWECALKGKNKLSPEQCMTELRTWLLSQEPFAEVKGRG